jgi:hypothetical protein
MALQAIDTTGNESMDLTLAKIQAMLTELYASDAANVPATDSGVVTSASLTTAAGATASISITDASITATSKVFAAVFNGTNSAGSPAITTVTPGLGAATVVVQNIHASAALNGTLKVNYFVVV